MAGGDPPASNCSPNATYSSVPPNVTTRVAFVLIDGIGDVAVPLLGGLTPLEAAHTPNLDAIAAAGVNGLMDPVEPGLACGSDTAHLSLLGYNPRQHYRGRGAFESMGAGIPMQPGDIAFKSNFAVLDEATGIVVKRRADRHFEEEWPILCRHLDGLKIPGFPDYQVSIKYATEHRCGVVVRGPGLSDRIGGTDPLKDGRALGVATPLDSSPEADLTARVVNALSDAIRAELKTHPTRSGQRRERMWRTWFFCAAVESGLRSRPSKSGTAVDDAGHDKAVDLKVRALEAVDRMVGQLAHLLWLVQREGDREEEQQQGNNQEEHEKQQQRLRFCLCVTGDHSTPILYGDHTEEPVPLAICDLSDFIHTVPGGETAVLGVHLSPFPIPTAATVAAEDVTGVNSGVWERKGGGGAEKGVETVPGVAGSVAGDGVSRFSESAAAKGSLGRFPGSEMMRIIKWWSGRGC
ncbi:unnamed protein product [Closterium sp. Naga37s-1]|nr:unnamed protein product [Closterium sp. Naga37s-1]